MEHLRFFLKKSKCSFFASDVAIWATIWCQGGYREGRSDWAMGRWQLLSLCELFEVSWGFRVTIASSSRTWALLLLFSHSCFGKMHLYGQRKHHTRLILWRMQWHLPDTCLVNLFWTFRGRMWRIGSGVRCCPSSTWPANRNFTVMP